MIKARGLEESLMRCVDEGCSQAICRQTSRAGIDKVAATNR